MKTIKYRQYYRYGDGYNEFELILPNNYEVYEVPIIVFSCLVKDVEGEKTKSYVIISYNPVEDFIKFGNMYIKILSSVYCPEFSNAKNIEQAPKIKSTFTVEEFTDYECDSRMKEIESQFITSLDEKVNFDYLKSLSEEHSKLSKNLKYIGSIWKLNRFTNRGIEVYSVGFKNPFTLLSNVTVITTYIPYNMVPFREYTEDENISKMFYSKLEENYLTIKNCE